MAFEKDTIAACATPPGVSALALVRVSGPKTSTITKQLAGKAIPARSPQPTHIRFQDKELDEVVLTFWPNPNSYTGEDLL